MTGQAVRNGEGGLEGVAPFIRDFWDVSISRMSPTATSDKVKFHLQGHGIEVRDVFMLNSRIKGTKAAKVRVALEQRDRVKSPEIWPQHCIVADWINFKKKRNSVNANQNGDDNGSL